MPIAFSTTAGGPSYIDVRGGAYNNVHQIKLGAAGLAASRDADGYLPPGLPVLLTGAPVSGAGQTAVVIGPEPVKLGSVDLFANVIIDGPLTRDAIEDNLGRVLSANELAALAAFRLHTSA